MKIELFKMYEVVKANSSLKAVVNKVRCIFELTILFNQKKFLM